MLLRLCEVSKFYSGYAVLKGVSLEFDGGVLGIYGPNGSGKTTLLSIIAGFEKPTCGRVFFEGREITALRADKVARLGIAMSFQIPRVFWNLSVKQNLMLASMLGGNWKEVCELFGLSRLANSKARELSQGELRLLQIAMAYATSPKLMLLDEPFSGLDVENAARVLEILRSISSEVATILTAHRVKLLRRISDECIEMRGGKLVRSSVGER